MRRPSRRRSSWRCSRPEDTGFNAVALAALRAARFSPARVKGRAVRVLINIPLDSKIGSR